MITRLKPKSWQVATSFALGLLLTYFVYHGLNGQRGLFAYRALEHQVSQTEAALATEKAEAARLKHRIELLGSGQGAVDADLLDEQARRVIGYAHPNDVILIPPPETGLAD